MRIMAELERCQEHQVDKTPDAAYGTLLDVVILKWCGSWYRPRSYAANS